jgi:octaprenyl-diphosphate synthase
MEISTARKNDQENPPSTTLDSVYKLVAGEFAAINHLIPRKLTSEVNLVEEISNYIVESGGKRLRPMMVLLSSQALGYQGTENIELAAIIEFLHTATLLHDDVVDRSGLRRGRITANQKWGNAPSVLVGDFLYSRAFQLMVELASIKVMAVLSGATNTIAEGEVMQLANVGNTSLTEAGYREVIRCKTALLFEAATHTGALLAQESGETTCKEYIEPVRKFGLHFGMAYQLVDDWLDYAGDSAAMGKNIGDDLAEGKLTLPLIQALKTVPEDQKSLIIKAIEERSTESLTAILQIVVKSGALDYTYRAAIEENKLALACLDPLPDTPYKNALETVARFSLARIG